MQTTETQTAPLTKPTSTPTRRIALWAISMLALVLALIVLPNSSDAHPTSESRREFAEAVALAKQANADALLAIAAAKAAEVERDDARAQRDEYRAQRDGARTDRDNLAGELAAYEEFMRRDRLLADERLVALTLAKAEASKAKRQRWIWAGVSAAVGLAVGVGVVVAIDVATP